MGLPVARFTSSAFDHDPTTTIIDAARAQLLRPLRFLRLDPLHWEATVQRTGASRHAGWRCGHRRWLASGAAQVRERQAARLAEPNLHAKLVQRMVMGSLVIDQEVVTRTFPEGPGKTELIATYQVHVGRIAKAWFIFGPKILDVTP